MIRQLLSLIFLGLFLTSSMTARSAELVIEDTKFVVQLFTKTKNGTEISQDFFTTVAPLVPGQCCFGWRIKVSADIGLINFREEFTVPSEPEYWSGENDHFSTNVIINDRRTSITNQFVVPDSQRGNETVARFQEWLVEEARRFQAAEAAGR